MGICTRLTTEKTEDIEKALNKLEKDVNAKGKGLVTVAWTKESAGSYLLNIDYFMDNRMVNGFLTKQFEKTFKKIDPKVKLEKIDKKDKK